MYDLKVELYDLRMDFYEMGMILSENILSLQPVKNISEYVRGREKNGNGTGGQQADTNKHENKKTLTNQ